MRRLLALAGMVALGGCGLDRSGLGPPGAGDGGGLLDDGPAGDDGGAGDGSAGAEGGGADAGPGQDGAIGVCVAAIPAGWTLVAYEPSRAACPAGYGASRDAVASPVAGAGACTCSCAVTTPPSCTTGSFQSSFGFGATCNQGAPALPISGTGCTPFPQGVPLPPVVSGVALGMSGGACTGTGVGDPAKVTTTDSRTCAVPAGSAEAVCGGAAPGGFSACIEAAGDVACPAGPFTQKHAVADSETLVCSACPSCTVTGGCTGASVTLFHNSNCTGPIGAFALDGVCRPTSGGGQLAALQYSAQVQATCAASGTTPSFQPAGARTVCCR